MLTPKGPMGRMWTNARGSVVEAFDWTATKAKQHALSLALLVLLGIGLAMLGLFATAFEAISWQGWFTIAVVVLLVFCLASNVLPTHILFAFALAVLVVFQCVDSAGALVGFGNRGVNTVAILYIVAYAVTRTNSLSLLAGKLIDVNKAPSLRSILIKLCIPLGAMSMFLNNTPIYVVAIPVLLNLSKKTGIAPSKLMMPVSISLILGGTLSLIGTSTNLVVSGLAEADPLLVDESGQPLSFGFFGLTKVGAMYFAVGILYVILLAPLDCMLPSRHGTDVLAGSVREYLVQVHVTANAKTVVGRSVQAAGLRALKGLFLVAIHREDDIIHAPGPDAVILAGDNLVFTGRLDTVKDLYQQDGGLVPLELSDAASVSDRVKSNLYEAAISRNSLLLVGKKIRDVSFRDRFQAAVLAVTHHDGSLVTDTKFGDYVMEGGDTLILEAKPSFFKRFCTDKNFSTVFPLEGCSPPVDDWFHIAVSSIILIAVVSIAAADVVDIWVTAIGGSVLMVLTKCISLQDASLAIDIPLMLTIALAFGVGSAVQQTGVGDAVAGLLVGWLQPLGPIGFLAAIYIAVSFLTEIITNNGAVAILFPIVSGIVKDGSIDGLSPYSAFYVLMLAGSASFLTPIGYQLNLMAHSTGNYHYSDWLRFGLPWQVTVAIVGVVGCYYLY